MIKQKVAMLAQGNTYDDKGFLASCKEGLERAKSDFHLEIEYNIDTTSDQYAQRIKNFCDQGFDLIIAIGYMWNDAVLLEAEYYPNVKFILVDTELSQSRENVISILFDVDEAAFPLGFLSAWWADSQNDGNPVTASVGALEIPQVRQFIEPFENGADYYNDTYGRNVNSLHAYAGSFIDPGKGRQLAIDLIEEGADVIFGVGSQTGNGALLGASELDVQGVGVDVDKYYSYPEVADILLSSAVKGLGNAIYEVVSLFADREFIGKGVYRGSLSNDGVRIAPFHDYDYLIPDSVKSRIEVIKTGIIDGSISTGWVE
ncbi:MAG: BMP family ABC transporter substrate-binding protein [Bacteroidota bacterium]|nr:BMP family ABC transporter substrate-binding protein [Bacteroidota bacterium]